MAWADLLAAVAARNVGDMLRIASSLLEGGTSLS